MLIYKKNFLTLFSLFIYIFCGRGLKGRAGCRQTEVQTDRQTKFQTYAKKIGEQTEVQTNRQTISVSYAKNWRTKNCQGAGSANSGADSSS